MDDIIIRIKTDEESVIYKLWVVLLVLEVCFFGFLPIRRLSPYYVGYMIVPVAILLFLYIRVQTSSYKRVRDVTGFLNLYLMIGMMLCLVHGVYSHRVYHESFYEIYKMGHALLFPFLSYVILYLIPGRGGLERVLHAIYVVALVYIVVTFLQALLFNFVVSDRLFLNSNALTPSLRNGRLRIQSSALGWFAALYAFFRFLDISLPRKMRKRALWGFLVIYAHIIYVGMGRMQILALGLGIFSMWYFRERRKDNQVYITVILITSIVLVLSLGGAEWIIDSFSTTGSKGMSTLTRIKAIGYFSGYVKDHLLLGFSMIAPYREDLIQIARGPEETAFFDDLGFLGFFFQYGLTSIWFYAVPMIRMTVIAVRLLLNRAGSYYLLTWGMYVYVMASSVTMCIMDTQRAFMFAVMLAMFEYLYKQWKKQENRRQAVEGFNGK